MSHSAFKIKLSSRLQQIKAMVTKEYDHIWDCCCDHGLLGFALLSETDTTQTVTSHTSIKKANEETRVNHSIHFVDIVPDLISGVTHKLERFYNDENVKTKWFTHCIDVAKLPLDQHQGRHLIIIAGIGGDLMISFINAIHRNYPTTSIDFLLCPVHHQYALRTHLSSLDFSLLDEVLIEDNQRIYESLLVSTKSDEKNKINAVGDKIWQANSDRQQVIIDKYLQKTLKHYQRIQLGNANEVQHIIAAYEKLITKQA